MVLMTVRRETIDVTKTLRACFGETTSFVKDMQPDERICTACHGLGVIRNEQPFALNEPGQPRRGFPYTQQYVQPCPNCYTGVEQFCVHCGESLRLPFRHCNCPTALAERHAEEDRKENERRATCKQVPLSEYEGRALYDADACEYVYDEFEDLDPHHTYYACEESKTWLRPDTDDIIERLEELAYDSVRDCDGLLDFNPGHEEALQEALDDWFQRFCVLDTTYWPLHNVIVVVPFELPMTPTTDPDRTEGIE
jgi:hypothetical protein